MFSRTLILFMSAGLAAGQGATLEADLILRGGQIWTGVEGSALQQAVAVRGPEILATGSTASVSRLAGEHTVTIDLGGRFVMPGFIDNHTHFVDGGFQLLGLDLRPARSQADFAERIRRHVAGLPAGTWVTGGDWDHEAWPSPELPHRRLVDPYTPEHPVFVQRLDGHMALANTLALRLGGITRETPDPPGGDIVRDSRGEPTGVLKDAAMELVYRVVPAPSQAQRRQALEAALAEARRLGVTTVNAMASYQDVRLFQQAYREGALTVRVYALTPLPAFEDLARVGIESRFGNPYLKIGALKGFVDGSLGSTTAWFHAPYDDAPQTSGLPSGMWFPEGNLRRLIERADAGNFHLAIHAIGDRANDELLDIFEHVVRRNGPGDRRFRIEHAQHLSPPAFERMARLGVIASMQPYHAIDDGRWAEKRIGPERIRTTYAFRSLLDAGVVLTFGSDWTVAPLDPWLGVYAAVTRRTLDGANPGGWVPGEKISVEEALVCYTRNNAWAIYEEDRLGTLEAGKWADLVVLSDNPLQVDPAAIGEIRVLRTLVGGKTVFQRDN